MTDADFAGLRRVLHEQNLQDERLAQLPGDAQERHVMAQISELTWLIGHFCLLNRWFTALQVPDEGSQDEDNFTEWYAAAVPADIRAQNARILAGG